MSHTISCKCPACNNKLTITRMSCKKCGTSLDGEFEIGRFSRLDKEQIAFLECFVRCRGSLKLMEGELDLSYPTLKNKLDEAAMAMGLEAVRPVAKEAREERTKLRMDILDKLERGEITASQAKDMMRE